MNAPNAVPKGTVIVAVAFDDQTAAVVQAAISLARRFGVALRFVHVVFPTAQLAALDYSAALYANSMATPPSDEELVAEASVKMAGLLQTLPTDVTCSSVVLTGLAVPVLSAEAVARRAGLILAACDPQGYALVAAGISTALGLMHEAPLPVLVVHRDCGLDFSKPEFHLLLADDLQASTAEAVRKAYELAVRLGRGTQISQVHVHGDFREVLRQSWTEAREVSPFLPAPADAPEVLRAREAASRQADLASRGQPWRTVAEAAGVKITALCRGGSVPEEIHQATITGKPDLIVFGRHRVWRARPFLIGRMPLRAMLNDRRAVLVVPPTAELYARVAFPG